jgi:hypothetical protein
MANSRRIISVLAILVLSATATMSAQPQPAQPSAQPAKQTVSVSQSGGDAVGNQFAFNVREIIRRSAGFELTDTRIALFHISIVTLDPETDSARTGHWSVASVVITMRNWLPLDKKDPQTWYPIFLDASVLTVGTNAVDTQAQRIVADLDAAVEKFKADINTK